MIMKNKTTTLKELIKDPKCYFNNVSKEGTLIIEDGEDCFVLSKAQVEKVIIPDQQTETILRHHLQSKMAEGCPVDLGLSVKWAAGNLFAIKETDFGGFFYPGEIEPRTFAYGMMGEIKNYSFTENIPLQNDAVHQRLGSLWRMPTAGEFRELIELCDWKFSKNYQNSGVNGWIVSSNIEGYKDNYIFLPATSAFYDPLYEERMDLDDCSILFSSSIDEEGRVKYLNIDEKWEQMEMENFVEIDWWRWSQIGAPIRGVCP